MHPFMASLLGCLAWLLPMASAQPQAQPAAVKAYFVSRSGRSQNVSLEVADTPATLAKGLMYRRRIPERTGMLFVFADALPRSFWMKDTYVALDIIYVGSACQVVHVLANAEPHSTKDLHCAMKSQYVVELAGGSAARLNIQVGDKLVFTPPLQGVAGCPAPAAEPAAPGRPSEPALRPAGPLTPMPPALRLPPSP